MKISIQTTADRMIVRDIEAGTVLDWADVVMIQYGAAERRSILFLGCFEDSTIEIVSAPPAEPAPTPTPAPAKPPTPVKPPAG